MPDKIITDRLKAIMGHIGKIEERMVGITSSEDFRTKEGEVIFDAILIRLQAFGENIKKIESVQPGFVDQKLSVDVDNIIRFRDIISHHYEKLDTEVIHHIITHHVPELKVAIKKQILKIPLLKKKAISQKDSLLPKKRIRNSKGPRL